MPKQQIQMSKQRSQLAVPQGMLKLEEDPDQDPVNGLPVVQDFDPLLTVEPIKRLRYGSFHENNFGEEADRKYRNALRQQSSQLQIKAFPSGSASSKQAMI